MRTRLPVLLLVSGLATGLAGCAGKRADPTLPGRAGAPGFAAEGTPNEEAVQRWLTERKSYAVSREIDGLVVRIESTSPNVPGEWEVGDDVHAVLPLVFRVTVTNESERSFEITPHLMVLLDDQRRRVRVAGFRAIDGRTSYFSTPLYPGQTRSWEVGFRDRPGISRAGTTHVTLVFQGFGPRGAFSEEFAFERIAW